MSALSGNRRRAADLTWRELVRDWRFQLSAFLFAAPLVAGLWSWAPGADRSFSWSVLLIGGLVEFAADALLLRSARFSPSLRSQLRYSLRIVVGLPLTIYLAIAFRHPAIAMLRFVPALALLAEMPLARSLYYLALFSLGLVAYKLLQNLAPPTEREALTLFGALALGALVLYLRHGARRMLRRLAVARLQAKRAATRAQKAERRLVELFRSEAPPDLAEQRLLRRPGPESGLYLAVAIYNGPLLEDLDEFDALQRPERLREFDHDYRLYCDYLRGALEKCGYQFSVRGPRAFALFNTGFPVQPVRDYVSACRATERRQILETVFTMLRLREWSARQRLNLESRGKRGWYTAMAVAAGALSLVSPLVELPGLQPVGPLLTELELRLSPRAAFRASNFWKDERRELQEDLCLVHPEIAPLVTPYFLESATRYDQGWMIPSTLKSSFASAANPQAPADDFFERGDWLHAGPA